MLSQQSVLFTENIIRQINASRKIVFFITRNFLQSVWCNEELLVAHHVSIKLLTIPACEGQSLNFNVLKRKLLTKGGGGGSNPVTFTFLVLLDGGPCQETL